MSLPAFTRRQFNYAKTSLPFEKTSDHPLILISHNTAPTAASAEASGASAGTESKAVLSKKESFVDPLNDPMMADPLSMADDPLADPLSMPDDPLSGFGGLSVTPPPAPAVDEGPAPSPIREYWALYKQNILKSYQVTSVKVSASFMTEENDVEATKTLKSVDRTKERLKQLDGVAEDEKMLQMTQSEYTDELRRLHKEIARAWAAGERVLSIKVSKHRREGRTHTLSLSLVSLPHTHAFSLFHTHTNPLLPTPFFSHPSILHSLSSSAPNFSPTRRPRRSFTPRSS
jgi:hypothetical protein